MLPSMTSNHASFTVADKSAAFNKVGENLYRLAARGGYYALLKRGDKQFRRSLKTNSARLSRIPSLWVKGSHESEGLASLLCVEMVKEVTGA